MSEYRQSEIHHNKETHQVKSTARQSARADAARIRRSRAREAAQLARRIAAEMEYPHKIHPALVPGVSVEDQKIRYGVDKPIVYIVGIPVLAFIAWGIISPETVQSVSQAALNWVMLNVGWIFNLIAVGMMIFLLAIALSKYGRIPLGLDGEQPEYSTASWAAMLFAAGIGIGIVFFGPLEPLNHYLNPLPGSYEASSMEAVKGAMAQSALHWGVNAWAIYAIVGLAVAYVSFRKGRVPLMSSVLEPLFGMTNKSPGARLIDGLAILATLFGTAASLGIGALQIGRGVEIVSGWSTTGNTLAIGIIVVLTIGTIASAVSGVSKGIRRLSNINMVASVGLAVFFFVGGPTLFLLNVIPGVVMTYVAEAPTMLSATMVDSDETRAFLSSWTTFYWAWWVSWAPFVGVFVAKISRGRTIRQFVLGVLLIPSTIIILAFTILGGTAIYLQRSTGELAPDGTVASLPPAENVVFAVLEYLPGAQIVAPLIIVILGIFFITSADSASLINSQLSQGGNPEPRRSITAFWALCMSGIAIVMLLMGGSDVLQALQNLVTVTALPFSIILVLMAVSFWKELRQDPMMIRHLYERNALSRSVRQGIEEHGDNFALTIEPTEPDSDYAAGTGFDSSAEEVTQWYIRHDEDGNEVEYDYVTGEYIDDESTSQEANSSVEASNSAVKTSGALEDEPKQQ